MPAVSRPLKLLFLSTPVGPLGSGLGGGVELTLTNLVSVLLDRGHEVAIAAPETSVLPAGEVIQIPGAWQLTAHTQGRETPAILPAGSVLANLWNYARQVQGDFDLLVNFAYDWLPFYLTPFFQTPIAHFVSMGSLSEAMDQAIIQVEQHYPGTLGAYTQTQVETFPPLRDLTRIYDLVAQISQMLGHATEDEDPEVRQTASWALEQLNRIRQVPGASRNVTSLEASRKRTDLLSGDRSN